MYVYLFFFFSEFAAMMSVNKMLWRRSTGLWCRVTFSITMHRVTYQPLRVVPNSLYLTFDLPEVLSFLIISCPIDFDGLGWKRRHSWVLVMELHLFYNGLWLFYIGALCLKCVIQIVFHILQCRQRDFRLNYLALDVILSWGMGKGC